MAGLRVIGGDADPRAREFERLYRESYPRVYSYVRMYMGSDADAEDVVAEAFLNAARAFDGFDPARARFSTWVTKIAINRMREHWRHQRPVDSVAEVPETTSDVPSETEAVDDRLVLDRLMACLTDDEAQLVILKYHGGMRNIDIAHELGLNPSTVSSRLFNAMRKMRKVAEGE